MKTHSTNDEIYIGRGAGDRLKEDLGSAKRLVKIVSPYLTASYVEDLLKMAKRGVKVTLITANTVEEGDGNYSMFTHTDLIKQKRHVNEEKKEKRNKGMFYSALSLIIPVALFFLAMPPLAIVALIVVGLSFYWFYTIRIYHYTYHSPIDLMVVPDEYHDKNNGRFLIHSKIYVIDNNVAYVGSVNYTYRAFNSNHEVLTRVSSPKAVSDISVEVDRIFSDRTLRPIDISEWGKELYPEPRH